GASSGLTAAFAVKSTAPIRMTIVSAPYRAVMGTEPFQVIASAVDRYDNVATDFQGEVTASLLVTQDGATLGGTTTVTASAGIAHFTNLVLDTPGRDFAIRVSAAGLGATKTGL